MVNTPFRSPLLRWPASNQAGEEHRAKRPRVESEDYGPRLVFKTPGVSSLPRKPLLEVDNPTTKREPSGVENFYSVLWRKMTTKKHKTWEGNALLLVTNGVASLQNSETGDSMGKAACSSPLLPGSGLAIGGMDIEIETVLTKALYLLSKQQLNAKKEKDAIPEQCLSASRLSESAKPRASIDSLSDEKPRRLSKAAPMSMASKTGFRSPLPRPAFKTSKQAPKPRYDPLAPGALVMRRPNIVPTNRQVVDVVVDPILSSKLRDHQKDGVKFMYECVMGMRDFDGQGAILADEMGLGKTLQTIALLWTLLKQNPIFENPPVVKKALIVCPVTLINNWKREFRKWLGADRVGIFTAEDSRKRITDFTMGRSYSVMIVGYEKLRTVQDVLMKGSGIDLIIADEAHRLKTAKNKSAQAIKALQTRRRIFLSGTPIQNDLNEFYFLTDTVNPDLLGSFKTFTKEFEIPIMKSQQPGASEEDVEKGQARSDELASLTSTFVLRRTADILAKYLPCMTEYVLLCRPTEAQSMVYQHVLACPAFRSAMGNTEASLRLITVLKKVCNSPFLLNGGGDPSKPRSPLNADILSNVPAHLLRNNAGSTKLRMLDQLLHTIRTTTSEKVVLVSNYTSTLDLVGALLTSVGHPFLRLDGSTPSAKRQDLVDSFNRSPVERSFAFLLSAKSGGVGLNLIGASRLVLFDVDWNPATDLQAMARIHRDGQKRDCFIYRFLMAGGIDEKMWQRQIVKLGLASSIMDQKGGASSFTREELKDLFRLDEGLTCQTHDLIGCPCEGRGVSISCADDDVAAGDELLTVPAFMQADEADMDRQEKEIKPNVRAARNALMAYTHIDTSHFGSSISGDEAALISDDVLLNVLRDEESKISFVFSKISV